jgi:citrate lyase subunit beta/citryl-CoA lyase
VSIGTEDGDLQTDLGCAWSIEGTELLYARSKVLLDARAAGIVNPLDGVFSDLGDEEGLITDSRLQPVSAVGRPSSTEADRAGERAYAVPEEDVATGGSWSSSRWRTGETAAVTVNGKMVDYTIS